MLLLRVLQVARYRDPLVLAQETDLLKESSRFHGSPKAGSTSQLELQTLELGNRKQGCFLCIFATGVAKSWSLHLSLVCRLTDLFRAARLGEWWALQAL